MNARRTEQAHALVRDVVTSGGRVIDATMGNGHDTVFLAQLVGPEGHVFGFDVQEAAHDATRHKLRQAHILDETFSLVHASHAAMDLHIPLNRHGHIDAVMFNLGYLPGANKDHTTEQHSTLAALRACEHLLAHNAIVTVVGYVGHAAGREEVTALEQLLSDTHGPLRWSEYEKDAAPPTAPRLFVGRRLSAR